MDIKRIDSSTTQSISIWRALLGSIVLLALLCAPAPGQDAADLVKDTNKILRDAERNMYSGKNDEAIAQLIQAAKNVKKIETEDADNKSLRSLKSKMEWLRKNLARKTGKQIDLDAGTVTAGAPDKTKKTGTAKPASASKKLPGGVTYRLKQIDRPLKSAEQKVGDKDSVVSAESRVKQWIGSPRLVCQPSRKGGHPRLLPPTRNAPPKVSR